MYEEENMSEKEIRDYFLSKPGAVCEQPFHIPVPVFKVGKKIFGLINIDENHKNSINLKYHKYDIDAYRSMYNEIIPGYHMSKNNWNTVFFDGDLEDKFIKELIDISYEIVFNSLTKKVQDNIMNNSDE